jgi:ribosomal protein S27E
MRKNKFLKIACPKCKTKKIIFGKASTSVKCDKCNYVLTKPTGGKSQVKALIRKILWQ